MTGTSDGTEDRRIDRPDGATPRLSLEATVRAIAHDLNGALNNVVLNVELLDAATASDREAGFDADARARALANLRRAAREIQGIVECRLVQLGRPEEPAPAAGT